MNLVLLLKFVEINYSDILLNGIFKEIKKFPNINFLTSLTDYSSINLSIPRTFILYNYSDYLLNNI